MTPRFISCLDCPGVNRGGSRGPEDAARKPPEYADGLLPPPRPQSGKIKTLTRHDKHPEVVQRLTKLLNDIIENGRSTAGAPQKNDVPVVVAKPNGKAAKE